MPGESLCKIAGYYNVTIAKIMDTNQLPAPNGLVVGESLVIPTEDIFHKVSSGETPWKQTPVIYVNAYIYQLKELAAPIIIEDGKHLNYLSPFAYKIKEDGSLYQAHDYEAHGRIVDFVMLMTYECGYR